jgi:hypothetical protein
LDHQRLEKWRIRIRIVAIPGLERTCDKMNSNVRDCLVTGYEPLIEGLTLPDPDDRHVLAAAILAGADVRPLARFSVEAQHPDKFIARQLKE